MSAENKKCKYKTVLEKCSHPVYEDDLCIFHLPKPDKSKLEQNKYARCEKIEQEFTSKFKKLMKDTEENELADEYDFRGFQFPEISYIATIFRKIANFSGAEFQYKYGFSWVLFQNEAKFRGAKFQNKADFSGAEFQNKADFSHAKFQNKADFRWAKFQNVADFRWATFEGKTLFQGIKSDKKDEKENLCFYGPCYFNEIELGEKAKVAFNNVNLSQASFLDTNIENFTFRDVTWHQPELARLFEKIFLLTRGKALYDEFRPLHPEPGENDTSIHKVDYFKLAENYSQLVNNYEYKRDFISARDFRIGEIEVRRKSLSRRERYWWQKLQQIVEEILYNLYRITSNYGYSYQRACAVLFIIIFIFAGLFLFFGFQLLSPQGAPLTAINYNWSLDPAPLWQTLCDYGRAFLFTLSILTLQRSRFYVPAGAWSQLWLFLATIFLYSQVTLLLLAIRRRFKQ